jgi:hypothetical protein
MDQETVKKDFYSGLSRIVSGMNVVDGDDKGGLQTECGKSSPYIGGKKI